MEIFDSCSASGGGVVVSVLETKYASALNAYYSNSIVNSEALKDTAVVLAAGGSWLDVPIHTNALNFTENPMDSSATAYAVALSFFVAGNDVTNIAAFESLNGKSFLIDFTDNNKNRRLVGFVNEPMKLSIGFDIPDSVTGVSGHSLTFSGVVSRRAPKYAI